MMITNRDWILEVSYPIWRISRLPWGKRKNPLLEGLFFISVICGTTGEFHRGSFLTKSGLCLPYIPQYQNSGRLVSLYHRNRLSLSLLPCR